MIADLHIHSRYAAACSKQTNIDLLEKHAKIKGVDLLGTGDFTHPLWIKELKEKLSEDENGILWTKNKFPFLWQTEISLAYTQDGKGRRVHHVVLAPNGEVVKQITDELLKKGRVDYDGRPIFGMSSVEFVEKMSNISSEIEIIPAHAWTSWFGALGSKSGFDSLQACFQEKINKIHAFETGMSSDVMMNMRIKSLDNFNIVSFSDMHSFHPWRLGREATIFSGELTYKNILNAIRTGKNLDGTIEVYPEYGKYHWDGHRLCNIYLSPDESRKNNGICPKCHKPLTIGVEYRVEELADRPLGFKAQNYKNFYKLIPLTELIAFVYNIKQLGSKKCEEIYNRMITHLGNEYDILINKKYEEMSRVVDKKLVDLIILNREGKLKIKPGYDGVYGEILLNNSEKIEKQATLF
ncbi:MAG: endonuclease Q family protein [Candidatus Nanoarchaeia archaeon]|nr:endonuclease Q family protein [Candidatus Nanoarchaeia archaeon]